jgi:hypothetical protein
MKAFVVAMALLAAWPAIAQESRIGSDWRREREHIAESCGAFDAKKLASCAVTLITDYPVHVALGNLAPQNGFGFGLAFSERYTPNEDWRISFNADATAATTSSWRAGTYITIVRSKVGLPTVSTGAVTSSPASAIREYPVLRVYGQHTVLNHLVDFGPDFDQPRERVFGETQSIFGASAVLPVTRRIVPLSVIGGINSRFISIHDSTEGDTFAEFFEGVQVKPSVFASHLRLNYNGRLHQFVSGTNTSFRRWSVDLRHEIPLYRSVQSTGPNEFNGPDDCGAGPSTPACPPVTWSRNLGGSIGFRMLAISSTPSDEGGTVPFYLQPTLGGSDINNQRLLSSFEDYRFRAPHLIAMQLSLEHSIWGPVGAFIIAERGKAVQQRNALDLSDLLNSYSAGLSIRAGGAPMITASAGWGDGGRRFIVNMDSSLLGGSARPSLH